MINLKKILCPIDYSEGSKEVLKYAVSFAMKDEATLYLLHVIDMRTFEDELTVKTDKENVTVHLDLDGSLKTVTSKLKRRTRLKLLVQRFFLRASTDANIGVA